MADTPLAPPLLPCRGSAPEVLRGERYGEGVDVFSLALILLELTTKTLPYTVVIDRNFEIAKVHTGYNPGDEVELRHLIDSLLTAGAGAEPAKAEPAAEATPAQPVE